MKLPSIGLCRFDGSGLAMSVVGLPGSCLRILTILPQTDGPHGSDEGWQPLYESYVADGLPSGAPVPGLEEAAEPGTR